MHLLAVEGENRATLGGPASVARTGERRQVRAFQYKGSGARVLRHELLSEVNDFRLEPLDTFQKALFEKIQ